MEILFFIIGMCLVFILGKVYIDLSDKSDYKKYLTKGGRLTFEDWREKYKF